MRAGVLALLIALAAPPAASQLPDSSQQPPQQSHDFLTSYPFLKPEQVLTTLRRYHDAVRMYRHGETAQALAAVDELPRQHVEVIMQTLRRQRRSRHADDIALFDWTRDDLAAAGMLHGDLTIAKVDKIDFEAELRLTLSMLMIADSPKHHTAEQPGTLTRDWLRAAGAAMLAERDWGPLEILLKYVSLLHPDDGPLLLVRGTLRELQSTSAAPPVAFTFAEGRSRARADRDAVRQEAVDALGRAVRALPASDEAAVRLAHVRMDLGQDARAAALLDRVLASEASGWWYLAALMRGEIDERTRDLAAAEGLYRRLIDRFPQRQSPYLALAMLQYANGRRDDSTKTLDRMYGRPSSSDQIDPWWEYPSSMGRAAYDALERLRGSVRE